MRVFSCAPLFAAAALAACSPAQQSAGGVCGGPTPPAACSTTCDPNSPSNQCEVGFHCGPAGTCDAQCASSSEFGTTCGSGEQCTSDGYCQPTGEGPDAACPNVHFMASSITPSIELVIDRSGSMDMTDISPSRFKAIKTGLVGTTGVVKAEEAKAYFGATMFAGDQGPCLSLAGYTVPRALNNAVAIGTLLALHPPNGGSTPTAPAIDQVVADFAANPPPAGSPPIILLATDGEPNSCSGDPDNGATLLSTQAAHAAGIRLFILGLANLNTQFLQEMANAGVGAPAGSNAPYYTANDPTSLETALQSIIGGVLSCDLTLSGGVNTASAASGTVTLNGTTLTYGTDWTLVNSTTLELTGAACDTLKSSANPVVDASFPCGSVIQ